jgi:hypothetical protein
VRQCGGPLDSLRFEASSRLDEKDAEQDAEQDAENAERSRDEKPGYVVVRCIGVVLSPPL